MPARPAGYPPFWILFTLISLRQELGTQIRHLDKEVRHLLKRKESARCAAKRHNGAYLKRRIQGIGTWEIKVVSHLFVVRYIQSARTVRIQALQGVSLSLV